MANDRHSYVEFYASDWVGGTAFMPPLVEWAYLQICIYNWDKAEALPAPEVPIRLSRSPSWEADLAMLISAGKVIRTHSGGLFVERAMAAANKAYDLWTRKSRGGKNKQAPGNAGESEGDRKSVGKTPPKSPASNQNQNQSQNHSPPNGGVPPDPPGGEAEPPLGDLLFSVPADALRAFRDHRVKIKAPMTKRAEELLVAKLEKIYAEHGHDPTAVIEQSVFNAWRGVFPLKDQDDGGTDRGGGRAGQGRSGDGFTRAVDRGLDRR